MNLGKETILAAVAGFALGLLAAWLVWTLPQNLGKKQAPTTLSEESTAPPASETFTLQVSEPENEAISQTATIKVAGKTLSGAAVIVSGPLGDEVIEATADGKFTTNVNLEEGANEINITAYASGSGEEKSEARTVNYTKEEF